MRGKLILQEELDHRHHHWWFLDGQFQGQGVGASAANGGVLGLLMGINHQHLDLGAVVEQMGIFHPVAQAIQVDMAEGLGKEVQI